MTDTRRCVAGEMNKPSREDVLKVARECGIQVTLMGKIGDKEHHSVSGILTDLTGFAAAIHSMGYAAGAAGMKERAALLCDAMAGQWNSPDAYGLANHIRALPITPTNTETEGGQ